MKRRQFITLLGSAAAWPIAARAQPTLPVVGYLHAGTREGDLYLPVVLKGLGEIGLVEGKNFAIEYRFAQNEVGRLADLAADLVRRRVTVIAALPAIAALAAKSATTTIPIVFFAGGDAVEVGLVGNLNRPGGNLTGVNAMAAELDAKRIELLHELLPRATRLGCLVNPNNINAASVIERAQAAAAGVGCSLQVVTTTTNREIDAAFASLAQERTEGLAITPGVLFSDRRVQITTLAARYAIPTIFWGREFAEIGGLISYAPSLPETYREFGIYVGRILKGEKASELPVVEPTRFELVVNAQTARTIGIEVPPTLLARADEVIE